MIKLSLFLSFQLPTIDVSEGLFHVVRQIFSRCYLLESCRSHQL